MEGQTKTLTELVSDLCTLGYLDAIIGEQSVKLRTDIVDIATRKAYKDVAAESKDGETGTGANVTVEHTCSWQSLQMV